MSGAYHVDVLARHFLEEDLNTVIIGLNSDRGEDSFDVLSAGRGVTADGKE